MIGVRRHIKLETAAGAQFWRRPFLLNCAEFVDQERKVAAERGDFCGAGFRLQYTISWKPPFRIA
jgi:hypothetical protein